MVGQQVVLAVAIVVDGLGSDGGRGRPLAEDEVDDGRIVQAAVDVGADDVATDDDGVVGRRAALMNLVAAAGLALKAELHLAGGLLGRHGSVDR